MAQAKCLTTASREAMSREEPSKSTIPVRAAHAQFVAALAGNVPHPISAAADSQDIEARADHLEKVFAALQVYCSTIIGATAQNTPGGMIHFRQLDELLHEVSAEIARALRNAAEEMREHETWRAS